jgi:hypothetical protein
VLNRRRLREEDTAARSTCDVHHASELAQFTARP